MPARAQFSRWAGAALAGRPAHAPRAARALSALRAIVGERAAAALNARYRHKDRPTNVLSFEGAGRLPDGRNFLGELVICAPVVAREARAQGKTLRGALGAHDGAWRAASARF